jgi:hypothetical protein
MMHTVVVVPTVNLEQFRFARERIDKAGPAIAA